MYVISEVISEVLPEVKFSFWLSTNINIGVTFKIWTCHQWCHTLVSKLTPHLNMSRIFKKSRMRETKNLSTDSNDTKKSCSVMQNLPKANFFCAAGRNPNWNVTKTKMSTKLKCHQNWNVTKTEMWTNLKCHQNWNVPKTEMSPKLKCNQN